jgi:NifU-like protein involved in Fe-S cluster formation
MDEVVIKYYKKLLKFGFENVGSLENPSIFLDSGSENIPICGQVGDYLHLFISARNNIIENIKYLCSCDPTANVVIEILCNLLKGKTISEAKILQEKDFSQALGCNSEAFLEKSREAIRLLNRGLIRFESQTNDLPK